MLLTSQASDGGLSLLCRLTASMPLTIANGCYDASAHGLSGGVHAAAAAVLSLAHGSGREGESRSDAMDADERSVAAQHNTADCETARGSGVCDEAPASLLLGLALSDERPERGRPLTPTIGRDFGSADALLCLSMHRYGCG